MAEILGLETGINPVGFLNSGIGTALLWVFIIFSMIIIMAVILYFVYQSRVYRFKIRDFENLGGLGWRLVFRDKARLVKVGAGGEEILYLKKKKQYRAAYGRKQGINEYWYAQGPDGYYYNFILGDLDAKMGVLDIEPVERDMRMMSVAIRKNIEERYKKVGFMEKYGMMIFGAVTLIIFLVGAWYLMDKQASTISDINEHQKVVLEVEERVISQAQQILTALSNMNKESGLISAET